MRSPTIQLALGAACIGFAPILVKCVDDLGPTAIGLYRCLGGAGLLLLVSLGHRSRPAPFSKRPTILISGVFVLAGGIFAIDLSIWHRSILWAGAGMGTILGNTQVFYMALIGILWHREQLSSRLMVSVPLAFAGVCLLVGVGSVLEVGPRYWSGIVLGLLTGVVYSIFLLTLRWLESAGQFLGSTRILGLVSLSSALFLTGFAAAEDTLRLPAIRDIGWLFLLGLGPQAFGWLLIARNLPHMPVSRSGLILLSQPVLATILGALIFQEKLTGLQLAGAVTTLGAIYLGTTRHSRRDTRKR